MRLKMTVNGTEYVVDVEAEQEVRPVPALPTTKMLNPRSRMPRPTSNARMARSWPNAPGRAVFLTLRRDPATSLGFNVHLRSCTARGMGAVM